MAVPVPPPMGAPAGGPAGGINLPKSPVGGASGPGASPMVSPGDGAGMEAHVIDEIRGMMPKLLTLASKLRPGTPGFNSVIGAIKTLNGAVGKAPDIPQSQPRMAGPIGQAPPAGVGGKPPGIPSPAGGAGAALGGGAPMMGGM